MNLSKSKYCNGIQCKKILWLNKYKPDVKGEIDNSSILDNGNDVHEIAKNLLGNHTNIEFNENLSVMIENTKKELLKDKIVITEASFNYQNNFCSVDILKKENNEYEIYEVKGSTKLKDIFIDDISYQYYVLNNLGLNVVKCYVVHINSSYIRKGDLELDKLFIKEDVTNIVLEKQDEVIKNIKEINNYMENNEEELEDIDIKCFKPYECPFFKYCSRHLPDKNVFLLGGMRKKEKIELYKKGSFSYKDLLKEDINLKYKQQIEYELFDKGDYIDKENIKEFLSTLTYPLYFLDFESYQMPIPEYDNASPYEQIPFQYSLHYLEKENDKLKHKEFLAKSGTDPRRNLAEKLVKDIPINTCVLAYNMSFEKAIIKNLSKIYPDLSNHLMNIHDNIKDLMIPFYKRHYYSKNMLGSYSIKYVLPSLFPNDANLNYHNLDLIHNGSEAMNFFANLKDLDKQQEEYVRERLLRYCELDTYAMVKIYEKLKNIVK